MRHARHSAVLLVVLGLWAASANALSGTLRAQDGAAIPYAFIGLLDDSWQLVAHGATDPAGAFALDLETPPGEGARLVVQPPGNEDANGLGAYAHPPRMVAVEGMTEVSLTLPPVGGLVLHGYDADGNLLRWADYERRGMFGANFVYWTNRADNMLEASVWPVHDAHSREQGAPREMGLPGLMAHPGVNGVIQVAYWETQGYGNLWLKADNAGFGFSLPAQGETTVIRLNVELARSAVSDFARRVQYLRDQVSDEVKATLAEMSGRAESIAAMADPVAAAAQADVLLVDALRARDELELANARAKITHRRDGFTFGVFEGGPYRREPFEVARAAGFDLVTVLTGWAWCDLSGEATTISQVDALFGFTALERLGFSIKTHGGVWLQEYGILPERTRGLSNEALHEGFLAQQAAMLDAFGERIDWWEAMNEPAATNEHGFSRDQINALLTASAEQLKEAGRTTLVNSGIESNFGNKYQLYGLDNRPVEDTVLSYLHALEHAQEAGALDAVDIVGIQFYPGARNADRLGGINGPMMTLGWLVDTLDRYASFHKPIHITEFSVPARYDEGWTSGYWREPWTPDLQAEYAEAVFTIAYAHPAVESITWWDITDRESSVISGGLLTETGEPKPVFERLRGLIAQFNALPESAE